MTQINHQTAKGIFPAAVILWLGFGAAALAGPIGPPAPNLQPGQFELAVELDLASRDIHFEDRDLEERTRMYLVKGGYGLGGRINLYGAVGAASSRDDEGFDGDPGTVFGGGVRLGLFEYQGILVGVTGQALRFSSRDSTAFGLNEITLTYDWTVYDVALGARTKMADSNFYAAALYSKIDGELQASLPGLPDQTARFKEAHDLGLLMGGDAEFLGKARFGFELRLIHETALALRLSVPFGR